MNNHHDELGILRWCFIFFIGMLILGFLQWEEIGIFEIINNLFK